MKIKSKKKQFLQNMSQKPIILQPGDKIPLAIVTQLSKANEIKGDFPKYLRAVEQIFCLDPLPPITTEQKLYMAGFLEGEGSISVSTKKLQTGKFGVIVDPEFHVTQHINGVSQLHKALSIFQTGKFKYKSGSNATMVFIIDNRRSLVEKVLPFYETYCKPHSCPAKIQRLSNFTKLLKLLDAGAHTNAASMLNEVLPIWDDMRMQKGQSNQAFTSLKDAQDYIQDFIKKNRILRD